MTRDQLSELQRLATEVQRWIENGNLNECPHNEIRQLASLATMAANMLEAREDRFR